jgi:hypothetical protein
MPNYKPVYQKMAGGKVHRIPGMMMEMGGATVALDDETKKKKKKTKPPGRFGAWLQGATTIFGKSKSKTRSTPLHNFSCGKDGVCSKK